MTTPESNQTRDGLELQHPFEWWPRSPIEKAVVSAVLVGAFFFTIPNGFFGALFAVAVVFLAVTGIRFVWNRYQPRQRSPRNGPISVPGFVLRHPIAVGILVCGLLFLLFGLQESGTATGERKKYEEALSQTRGAIDEHNSFANGAERIIKGAAYGFVGDMAGAMQIDKDHADRNNQLEYNYRVLMAGRDNAAHRENSAESVINAVFGVIGILGIYFAVRRFKSWRKKRAASKISASPLT